MDFLLDIEKHLLLFIDLHVNIQTHVKQHRMKSLSYSSFLSYFS